jgi:hypothetical protein
MLRSVQRYISCLLLALFLFPMVEKQLHAFEHAEEFHCTSTDKHFHDAEHSCEICDFTFSDSTPAPAIYAVSIPGPLGLQYYLPSGDAAIDHETCIHPGRAPPIG